MGPLDLATSSAPDRLRATGTDGRSAASFFREERMKAMKCQSDYDNEDQAQLRQADECVEEWWDPEAKPGQPGYRKPQGDPDAEAVAVAESEGIRRGLLRVDEEGGVCLSCPEETSKGSASE
jgi:hypothetical protein